MKDRVAQLQQDLADEKLVMESTIRALEQRRGAKEVSARDLRDLAIDEVSCVMSGWCILHLRQACGGGFIHAGQGDGRRHGRGCIRA